MLNNLKYKVANRLAKKSVELIDTGDFKNIMKGLKYFKYSVMIVPPSKELSDFAKTLRETTEEHQRKFTEDRA